MFSQEFSLFVVFALCPFPLSAHSLIARRSPCTCGITVFRSYSHTPDCLFLWLQIQTSNWLHDEISLELKGNELVVKRFAGSPLFWCGGLWWFKNFCPLLSHHPVGEMKPGIIYRTRGPHFPWSKVYSGFPVCTSDVLLYICWKKYPSVLCWFFTNPHTQFSLLQSCMFIFENPHNL